MRSNLLALFCLISLASCHQQFYYRPAPTQPEQPQIIYSHGVPSVRLNENGIDLAIDLTSRGNRDMNVRLAIRNQSDSIFNFMPELVRVYGYDESGRKTPYRVFTAEQYIRRRNTRNAVIAGVTIAATVATVAAVANSGGGSNDDDNDNDRNDNWYWAAVAIPNVIVASGNPPAPFHGPIDGLLRPHTLYPGEELRGIVKVQARNGFTDKILVEIPIDGGYKQFVFDRRERRF